MATKPSGNFLTEWEYDSTHEVGRITLHVWKCEHREGYTAYQTTRQPENGASVAFVKPTGTGHYTGADALRNKTGIVV